MVENGYDVGVVGARTASKMSFKASGRSDAPRDGCLSWEN